MSLTASMWTSVTGLISHGKKMNVVGNNIANVNTVGFKGSRMDFSDFVHQDMSSISGMSQVGRGVTIGAIYGDFSQGAFENSNDATDLAIAGNGFFKVHPKGSTDSYYTRAGNFRFDADGYLCDPNGYVLQGWEVEKPTPSLATGTNIGKASSSSRIIGTGVPQDVRLSSFSCDPRHTGNITLGVNLASKADEASISTTAPFASLLETWNVTFNSTTGEYAPPLGNDGYIYPQSITVYDEGGTAHVLTVYFDKAEQNVVNGKASEDIWEYIVTMDPSEDNRVFKDDGTGAPDEVPDAKKGLLMAGTLKFNSSGQMTDMSAYVPTVGGANFDDLNNWLVAPISTDGYPMFAANFTGRDNASEAWGTLPTTTGTGSINTETIGYLTEFNIGFQTKNNYWDFPATAGISLGDVGLDAKNLVGMGSAGTRQQPATTSYDDGSFERAASQNGYSYGELAGIYVDKDGVLVGNYSNGVSVELFQITMYDFQCKTELHRDGGNLYSQTRSSGDPTSGAAGTGSFGAVYSNSLEQSNVDLATEFVQMITTQRGFQANSKSITTTDTMLETVINMKR